MHIKKATLKKFKKSFKYNKFLKFPLVKLKNKLDENFQRVKNYL